MQNDLKYGKISELCGINGYFAGKNREKKCACGSEKGSKFTHIFMAGGKEFNF